MQSVDFDLNAHSHFVSVNGIEMCYIDYGEGDPVLLLHGGTGTALSNWGTYLPALSKNYRIIAPDFRGHGRTNNPSGEWRYDLMADDIAALVKKLGLQNPSICGWSDGGQIGLELAMRYPNLSSKYLVGAVWKEFSATYLETLFNWGLESAGKVNIDKIQEVTPDYIEVIRKLHSIQGPDYWKELLKGISKLWLTPVNYKEEDFRGIMATMLIVVGDRDQFIPLEDAISMYRLIPNAEISVVPNVDHSLPRSKVEVFTNIITDFLNGDKAEEA